MIELLWLLLPVAALSGWYAARGVGERSPGSRAGLAPDYFRGLNYLLNEQPDKAIEVFIRVLEVDTDTVETHLALGSLYRRRGEVDRAIRIHQNVVARSSLSESQRLEAIFELGRDYMSAGLLDRAEGLMRELTGAGGYSERALEALRDIYEQEKDWERATEVARRLEAVAGRDLGDVIAQYWCEQAVEARLEGRVEEAHARLARALRASPRCARASLLEAELRADFGQWEAARQALARIGDQDPDYLPVAVEQLRALASRSGEAEAVRELLERWLARYGGISVALVLAELQREQGEEAAALRTVRQALERRPTLRGFAWLLDSRAERDDEGGGAPAVATETEAGLARSIVRALLANRPRFRCRKCGFAGELLHWQCPGCKRWSTVRPIEGIEGE